ncbi:DHA2 family efflux MFS transporter permease subunit [Paludisphaera rhizosphaerae]|uniref:DHA2 family efflux MFS transporter permease subunit n=1 Tax=Paludisphaera rhizosphaerae TaxID=2711216 RepID=UPI0013EBDCE3|nr:DHA2 family efflux MFS transporter permease subunit [Paludisphaera rhizosphaerae]
MDENAGHVNPWLIATAVTIATFMEVLDTSIANVALRYIAGGLSAAADDSEWVITAYLAANASVLLLSGWLGAYLGRRNYYLLSLAVFTASSAACGFATSLEELIFFRVLQGLGGGGLQPVTQAVLLDSFPPEKQGQAQAMFVMSALVAPVLGPTVGGYIADNYGWEWIFLINIPPGLLALWMNQRFLHDPPYLVEERRRLRSQPLNFDWLGLGLIVLSMICMEVLLSKGQEWDWFDDPFGRVQVMTFGFVGGFVALIAWEKRHPSPVLNLAPFLDRNFAGCCIIGYVTMAITYASMILLPGMVQTLFGYNAVWSGLIMSPAGLFSIPAVILSGYLVGRGVNIRAIIVVGALLMAAGALWFTRLNLEVSPGHFVWPRVVQQIGTASMFAPLSVAAFLYLPPHLRGPAAGIFAAVRNEGGSLGTTLGKTIVTRRFPFHTDRLAEYFSSYSHAYNEVYANLRAYFYQLTGDPETAGRMALDGLDTLRSQQAMAMAYLDAFWVLGLLALTLIPLAFLLKPSQAAEGTPVGAH